MLRRRWVKCEWPLLNSHFWKLSFKYRDIHPKLDLVNFAVRSLLFTKSCSSLNWICSKNEIGWNYSELKDINLKYILSKDSLRYININLPMFCNFQLLNIPIFKKIPKIMENILKITQILQNFNNFCSLNRIFTYFLFTKWSIGIL